MDKKSKENFLDKLARTFDLIKGIGTSIADIEKKVDANTGRIDGLATSAAPLHIFGELFLRIDPADIIYTPDSTDYTTISALCDALAAGLTPVGTIDINGVRYSVVNGGADTSGYKLYLSWIEPTTSNTRLRTAKVVFRRDDANGGTITLRPIVVRQIDMSTSSNIVLDLPAINVAKHLTQSLPPVIVTDPYWEKTADTITLKS
ncbi:MAG: hypothetical protein NC418_02250, partial [Muribaculaceae bacterium]|nr:hypothetical protein [Muribaculaceae bacterium]